MFWIFVISMLIGLVTSNALLFLTVEIFHNYKKYFTHPAMSTTSMSMILMLGLFIGLICFRIFFNLFVKSEKTEYDLNKEKNKKGYPICFILALALYLGLLFGANNAIENFESISVDIYRQETKENYTHTINTFLCYTTDYGECYHDYSCRYLLSSNRTTVYEARQNGYRSCSACTPSVPVWLEVVEERPDTCPDPWLVNGVLGLIFWFGWVLIWEYYLPPFILVKRFIAEHLY